MFMTILLAAVTLLQGYVLWRVAGARILGRRIPIWALLAGVGALWTIFLIDAFAAHGAAGPLAAGLELVAMDSLAVVFLLAVCLLAVDVVTGFGWFAPRRAPALRGLAVLAGLALAAVAIVQGVRAPVVVDYEVRLAGLPAECDGTVVVAVSDTHLGSLIGPRWLDARVAQVEAIRPNMIVLLGDITEGHGAAAESFLPGLRRLSAPLGMWAVTGNHESFRRAGRGPDVLAEAGFEVLHDRWAEVRPGLVVAGVDDLTSRRRAGLGGDPVAKALVGRPPGATILLSHTPWQAEEAARLGVGLMLSAHTHGGQVWPFDLLEKWLYPLMAGRYRVGGMTAIVCRGTGTWGPRMRLWRPSEILRITLRAAPPG
ncbi:MAG: metallophosphoesterase [Acidobacteriia bacterium]|nr:metallophosphoesterase [Terriglobia bacterium]